MTLTTASTTDETPWDAVPKVASTTTGRSRTQPFGAVYPKMTVTIKASGIAALTGTPVLRGHAPLKAVCVGAAKKGRVAVTLPKRSLGYHYLVAEYFGR